ncbi:MAG: hypothetical protein ABEJ36_06290 [Candidatus Nanosalina sp.]
MVEDFIPTVSGKKLYYTDPEPEQIEIRDIAHGLAQHPRFGGQTERFFSVARHSVLVSRELEEQGYGEEIQLYGLLHDAAEAYTGDMPAPLKKELNEFQEIEDQIMDAIWRALDIPEPSEKDWGKVKEADSVLLKHEAKELVSLDSWTDAVERDYDLESDSMKEDRRRFLERYRQLKD